MVYQYATKVTDWKNEYLFSTMLKNVSEDRRRKIKQYSSQMDKWRSIIAEMLLRYALWEKFNITDRNIIFSYNLYGKPSLYNYHNIHFNFSHSGEWVLCGVGDVPLGVDVEHVTSLDLKIAKRFFHNKEYAYVLCQPETNQVAEFFHIWTLKESYIKARGEGMKIPLDSFYFEIVDDEIILQDECGSNLNYFFSIGYLDRDYCSAICINSKNKDEIKHDVINLKIENLSEWSNLVL